MKVNHFILPRTVAVLAGALIVLANVRAADADALPTFDTNYIKLSGLASSMSGNNAAYQAVTRNSKSGVGGIEDFNYTYDLAKDTNLEVNGKAMAGNANYLLQFKVTKNDFGSLEAGYKRFRTFYDDVGGFFPLNNAWLPIYRQPLFVDRGKFFVNATLALPKAPVFTFKYTNETRNGTKDTTIWGTSDLTGIIPGTTSNPPSRSIIPSYIQLGERQQTWEAAMRHSVGNTNLLLTVGGDKIDNLDTRMINRYAGELKPYPTVPTTATTPSNWLNNPIFGPDQHGIGESGYLLGAKVDTAINDQITVYAGINYRHAKVDTTDSRLTANSIMTATGVVSPVGMFTPNGRPAYSYTATGSIKQDIVTGNIGVQYKPMPDLFLDAALRGEQYKDSGHNDAVYISNLVVQSTGAVTPVLTTAPQTLKNVEKPWTPALDARYTGIKTVALYGSWEYRNTTQDERTGYVSPSPAGTTLSQSIGGGSDNIKEHHMNATLGANWTPVPRFSGRAEVFVKDHENHFVTYAGPGVGDYYNLDFNVQGAKLTAVVKPLPTVSFTTRYIVQRGKDRVQDNLLAAGPSSLTAGDSRRYTLGETVDWNPSKTVYLQANANVVFDTIMTAYPKADPTAQTATAVSATTVLHNADNNYWNGNVVLGFAIDKETDAELQGTYYRANNYNAALATYTLPYGMSAKESTITAGVKYKIDPKTLLSAKVGYFESKNDTMGGFTDFHGPLAYVSLERAF